MIKLENNQGRPWINGRVPNGYWDLRSNRIGYLRWLGERLGFDDSEDWYAIRQRHFKNNHGGGLLAVAYQDSPLTALRDFMPDRQWYPWLLSRTPKGFWRDIQNRRAFMEWLEMQLGIVRKEDWYHVTQRDFFNHGGGGLLYKYYGCSVAAAVAEFNPRLQLELWRFDMVPQRFWSSPNNFRRYMDWLGEKLKIRTPELWYGVSARDMKENHGGTPLASRGDSVFRMVSEYLPEIDWKPWLFQSTPKGFWQCKENRQAYLKWLGYELGFRRPSDWYKLTQRDFKRTGGGTVFTAVYRNSLMRAVGERYPNYRWDSERFKYHAKKS